VNVIWVVGELYNQHPRWGPAWRIVGVFSDKEKAIAECKADHYFVLEKSIDKTGETNGMEFPLSEKKE